jgi:hypothetical protein
MAGTTTATHEIELITKDGGGGGASAGNGNFGGGGSGDGMGSSAGGGVPQRTYVTGMTVGLGGILMFFMALVSAYIVRKGTADGCRCRFSRAFCG